MNFLKKLFLPKWVLETVQDFERPLTEAEKQEDKKIRENNNNQTDWVTPASFTGC